MSKRKELLASGEIYHLFNQTVGNEEILTHRKELNRAVKLFGYYRFPQKLKYSKFKTLSENLRNDYLLRMRNQPPLVAIYAFALMPDHYHLLLKQLQEGGIKTFISNFQNSSAKYFNLKTERHGALFRNPFKAKRVATDEEFIHISRYIHLNPVSFFLIEFAQLATYPWTSFSWYVDEGKNQFVDTQALMALFKSKGRYLEFVANQVDYQRKLGLIKRLALE